MNKQIVIVITFYSTNQLWQTLVAKDEIAADRYLVASGYNYQHGTFYQQPNDKSQTAYVTPKAVIE